VPSRPPPSSVASEDIEIVYKVEFNPSHQKLWNSARFSDLLIKFSGREIKAHRLVLCQASSYFDKLCGPDSQFMVRPALLRRRY
jgi:hypothetical protein